MDITIYDLLVEDVDLFISTDTDRFGRVIRKETEHDPTVDLLINVKGITITDNAIAITFPDNNIMFVKISSNHYHKIEVM